ncbi:hypothetical protein F8C76_11130 [Flagellimonas olearia]|uniref:Uncharacterized protein n=1 Tax=Flagellimonas olearia TaxID=552546 RepID=A0A6I1DUC4_9FLAO|nr:hypothetical protein [Allomuricauda olearia]KAB7528410.1 hypothetical protein F8C76_11130 [Allomuricauda olearia]
MPQKSKNQDPTTNKDGCKAVASYVKSIDQKIQKVEEALNDKATLKPDRLRYTLKLAKDERDKIAESYPECDMSDINTRIVNAEKYISEFVGSLSPFKPGSYQTSSSYFTEVTLDNFDSNGLANTMDISFKTLKGKIYKGFISYPSSTSPTPEKIEGKINDVNGLKLTAYKQEDNIIIEFYYSGDFAGVIFIGNKDKNTLRKEVLDFEIPGSESNGMYLGEVQQKEAGRIVLSKTDNLVHDNKGPFDLNEFTIGDKLYSRTFYKQIKPPVEILQVEGYWAKKNNHDVRVVNEFYLDGQLVATYEEGPFYDEQKKQVNSWTSVRKPIFLLTDDSMEEKFMEYVLKNNLPSKKYEFELKKYVHSADSNYDEDDKVFVATTGPITFNITDDGLSKLCATDFGPPKGAINNDSETKTLLTVLRKYAKAQGWPETFTNTVSHKTSWTKVYDVFNRYTHSKCSAIFRTEYPLEDGRKSYGVISAMFYKYPNGSIEVFGMSGQHYIPRTCR